MTTTNAEMLAYLRLVQGQSAAEVHEFVKSCGPVSMLTVGSDPRNGWCIEAPGVAPVHFTLRWDGATLCIADTHGVGRLRVDGVPLGPDWRALGRRARIEFGQATIVSETAAPEREPGGGDRSKPTIEGYAIPYGAGGAQLATRAAVDDADGAVPQEALTGYGSEPEPGFVTSYRTEPRPDSGGRIPRAVVVLSPSSDVTQAEVVARLSRSVPLARPMHSWRSVAVGVLAVMGGYASWIYVLYAF